MPSLNFTHVLDVNHLDSMRLVNGNVLIETFDNRAFQNGVHVHITEQNVFVPKFGKVVAVDPNSTKLKVGDQVCFELYKGDRCVSEDGKRTFLLMKESMVLATIDDIDVTKI